MGYLLRNTKNHVFGVSLLLEHPVNLKPQIEVVWIFNIPGWNDLHASTITPHTNNTQLYIQVQQSERRIRSPTGTSTRKRALLMGQKVSNPLAMVQGSFLSLACSCKSRAVISNANI
jgi:hypothetical protein